MNAKLIELADQRASLVARAAAQRAELSQALASWRRPLALADQGFAAARYLRSNPMLLGGVVAFLVALRPWRLARMALGAMGGKGILRGW